MTAAAEAPRPGDRDPGDSGGTPGDDIPTGHPPSPDGVRGSVEAPDGIPAPASPSPDPVTVGRLRAAFHHAPVAMGLVDGSGRIRVANPALADLLEVTDPTGVALADHIDADDGARRFAVRALAGQLGELRIEWRFRTAGDGRRWVLAQIIPLHDDPDGRTLVHLLDLTDQRWIEDELEAVRTRAEAVATIASDVLVVVDRNGDLVYVSPSARAMTGYEPHEALGQRGYDLVHPDDVNRVRHEIARRILTGETGRPVDFRLRTADGRWLPIRAFATNLIDDPVVGGLVVSLRDMSGRIDGPAPGSGRLDTATLRALRRILTDPDDEAVDVALAPVGEALGVDAISVWQAGESFVRRWAWVRPGSTGTPLPTAVDAEPYRFLLRTLAAGRVVHLPSVEALPPDRRAVVRAETPDLEALLCLPVLGRPAGDGRRPYLGTLVVTCERRVRRFDEIEIDRLRTIAGALVCRLG